MYAFLFSFTLFSFWAGVGFAVLSLCRPRLRIIQSVLISPAVGIATTVLPVFFVNRAGIPVKDFGGSLLWALAIIAVIVLAVKRPLFPFKRLFPAVVILIVALFLTGRPMLNYGFDWVSLANDDMANYSLGAQRFLNHGFFDVPNSADMLNGKEYSSAYWFMHADHGVRAGSELMLSIIWAFSGLNAHQIFMPVIMALHLALVSAVGSMVAGVNLGRRTPLFAMSILAISPLTTLGTLYQVIGQVGGLALLIGAVTLMYRTHQGGTSLWKMIGSIPAVLVFSATFVWYPEVLPIFALGWLLFVGLVVIRSKRDAFKVVISATLVGAMVLLALSKYVVSALLFMLSQASGGLQSVGLKSIIFPYFLVPSGLAATWGLIPISASISEPYLSLAVAGGLVLFYWLAREVIPNQLAEILPSSVVLFVMVVMGLLLFYRNNAFGLFKLAMFAQPFLAGVIATKFGKLDFSSIPLRTRIVAPAAAALMLHTQYLYVEKSTGETVNGITDIPHASARKVNEQFAKLLESNPTLGNFDSILILDTSNIVLAKFQALYTKNIKTMFPTRDFFYNISSLSQSEVGFKLRSETNQYVSQKINDNDFLAVKSSLYTGKRPINIYSAVKSDIFNAHTLRSDEGPYFTVEGSVVNRLQFIHSRLGTHYYSFGDRLTTSFYQLENDPMFSGQKIAALGRYFLFRAINPTGSPRVVMELTSTLVKQFQSELPQPIVQSKILKFTGRGTGRIFSTPIAPTVIDGVPYISIDMTRDGKQPQTTTTGLMALYGRDIPVDQRRITTYGRDISLVSEEQYQALSPPMSLRRFPDDLSNKNLEYSGIYEDGWSSERAFFVLSANTSIETLTVTGSIPLIKNPAFSTILKLSVNGKEIASQRLGLGDFNVSIPVVSLEGRQRVDIAFSKYQQLPGEDGRAVGGKLDFVGFK